jgi:hypothetical protein
MVRKVCSFPTSDIIRLRRLSEGTGVPQPAIIRKALHEFLERVAVGSSSAYSEPPRTEAGGR